jgi:hypothetical protein
MENAPLFREVNDRIRELAERWEKAEPPGFICECADAACTQVVNVSVAEYDAVRSAPGRFLLLRGHEPASNADVVASVDGYLIVEARAAPLGD